MGKNTAQVEQEEQNRIRATGWSKQWRLCWSAHMLWQF